MNEVEVCGWTGIMKLAEREGFEPSVEFPLHTLSKRAPSTTRTSLRLESTICERSAPDYRKTLIQNLAFPDAVCNQRATETGCRDPPRLSRWSVDRQREGKRASAAAPVFSPDSSAMSLDDALGNVQTESDAATAMLGRELNESLEHRIQHVRWNALAVISDREDDVVLDALHMHNDRAVRRRKLDGVTQQVADHLENPRRIERGSRQGLDDLRLDRQAASQALGLKGVDRLGDDLRSVAFDPCHRQHPRFDTCHIHEIADQTTHA